jgi:hypothetical protein
MMHPLASFEFNVNFHKNIDDQVFVDNNTSSSALRLSIAGMDTNPMPSSYY